MLRSFAIALLLPALLNACAARPPRCHGPLQPINSAQAQDPGVVPPKATSGGSVR